MSEQHASMWMSVGVFVATALASQVVQRVLSNRRKDEANDRHSHASAADDRPREDHHRYYMKRMSHEYSDEDMSSAHGNKRQVAENLESGDNVNDFQPKNNNWSHFENSAGEENVDDNGDDDSSSSEEAFLWTSSIRSKRRLYISSPKSEVGPETWSSKLKQAVPLRAVQRSFGISDSSHENESDDKVENRHDKKSDLDNSRKWRRLQTKTTLPRQSSAPVPGEHAPQVRNQVARAKYNARIMPNKVVMLRHGQSMGNINEELYSTTPDNAMPLTKLGWEQARWQGKVLKEQVLSSGESVHFIVSPYVRTVETFHGVVSAWCDPCEFSHIADRDKRLKAWYGRLLELGLTWHEDPRIREQDFGNYQDPEKIKISKKERYHFGTFFYRFAHGESGADVFDRVSTFLDSLWRSFYLNRARNYVIITHGIAIRVLLARYFRYSIDQFSMLANPKNCEMVVLRHDGAGRLQLEGRWEQTVAEATSGSAEKRVTGCAFHKCLRVLPSEALRKTEIRISYDDGLV